MFEATYTNVSEVFPKFDIMKVMFLSSSSPAQNSIIGSQREGVPFLLTLPIGKGMWVALSPNAELKRGRYNFLC